MQITKIVRLLGVFLMPALPCFAIGRGLHQCPAQLNIMRNSVLQYFGDIDRVGTVPHGSNQNRMSINDILK